MPKGKGRATIVVRDEARQKQFDTAARSDAYEAIRQGLDDVANGRTMPAREAFAEIRRKDGIPR